ncbi:hypothetical protein [Oscillatoria sp. HE19RPO]|uniref:hypothetical protein n=1 Tax=Oscillatoria sp. HE19RPO TaxID=2954806 RepID=UPI0020C4EAB4|nr:hypothetical protein [Oscillatoria sp. HE19RPO]
MIKLSQGWRMKDEGGDRPFFPNAATVAQSQHLWIVLPALPALILLYRFYPKKSTHKLWNIPFHFLASMD